ncbi:neuropeptide Y receptor type 5-like [Tigriopus californicus]|uniref:neuropeptide Y receptor type 5-like n=1 Tax=Tigriopus californicus TaxID=6832 RepID=UPI0027DA7A1F|nr:neuropeptide Y receptor type 5-like [Tigriopus californicus]
MNVTTHDQNEAAVNEPMPEDQEQQIQEEANMNLMPRTLPQDIINNQAVSDPAFYALSVFYCIVICGSVLGNLLVITAVLRSAHMRKVNNILIVNLAVSDLLLCTLVSPMTLMEILYKRWPGPHLQVLCILSGMVPRWQYKVIVYSATSRTPTKLSKALCSLLFIWSVSILLSCPLIFAMSLKVIEMPEQLLHIVKASSLAYCAEEWGQYKKGRLVYSIFSLVVQFILPLTLISFAHSSIKKKLRKLPSWQKGAQQSTRHRNTSVTVLAATKEGRGKEGVVGGGVGGARRVETSENETLLVVPASQLVPNEGKTLSPKGSKVRLSMGVKRCSLKDPPPGQSNGNGSPTEQMDEMTRIQNTRLQEKIKKQARTHSLLVSIVIVFALSWFPLNMLNIILDIHNIFQVRGGSPKWLIKLRLKIEDVLNLLMIWLDENRFKLSWFTDVLASSNLPYEPFQLSLGNCAQGASIHSYKLSFQKGTSHSSMTEELSRICFALCHLIGMSSAFSNPILYGWFNEAFKEEFQSIAGSIFCCLSASSQSNSTLETIGVDHHRKKAKMELKLEAVDEVDPQKAGHLSQRPNRQCNNNLIRSQKPGDVTIQTDRDQKSPEKLQIIVNSNSDHGAKQLLTSSL